MFEEPGDYCRAYGMEYAARQAERLDHAIRILIGESPSRWAPFVHTGYPYHAYLFRLGERTQSWIVYTFDEETKVIRLLRLWGTSRFEKTFSLT
ncbi:MAG TPA: hypothetical protein VK446_16915 [Methylocystis sp.]|nr:hypothetical protein [Methylocystis sp.]